MSAHQIEDTGGSIRLTDSDLMEVPDDSLASPEEVTNNRRAAEMMPFASPDAPTHQANAWEFAPPEIEAAPATRPQEEITNVRARNKKKRDWVDMHAVVDDEGRLRLPEDVARMLQPGAIVEVRVAAWAVDPAENS